MSPEKWNESEFINYISHQAEIKKNIIGIGDDCAVIPINNKNAWLVTTDALAENVHFLKTTISPQDLGYKTIAVNVSDISAMGGIPKYAFLSIAITKITPYSWGKSFMEGIKKACKKWNIYLLGGDTIKSKQNIFINLTLIGHTAINKIKYRNKALPGDVICVNGYLGNSGGGLKAMQINSRKTKDVKNLIKAHNCPQPSLDHGFWLSRYKEVHAMMDISDGLNCDLKKLLSASRKGASIEIDSLPISPSLSKFCKKYNLDPIQFALTGGEDYCLLISIDPKKFMYIKNAFQRKFHCNLFSIGHVNHHSDTLTYFKNGKEVHINYTNYNHFQ